MKGNNIYKLTMVRLNPISLDRIQTIFIGTFDYEYIAQDLGEQLSEVWSNLNEEWTYAVEFS